MLNKLSQRYRQLNPAVRMSLWYLVCSVLQKGIGMISTPVFTRIMTETEYGRYSIFNSWSGIFSAVISLNMAGGFYVRGLVLNEEDRESFTSSLVGLTGFMCLASLMVYTVFHDFVDGVTGLNFFLTAVIILQIFLETTRDFWINRRRVIYDYKPIVLVTLCTTILIPLLSVVFVKISENTREVEGRAMATLLVEILFFSGMALSIHRLGHTFFKKIYWKQAVIYSLPLIPHYLSKIVLNQSDRLMIGRYCSVAEAGYYSVAYSLASIFLIINQAVAASMDPWLYKCIREKSLNAIRSISMKILLVMVVMNLGVIGVAPEVLRFFAPANFYKAVWVIPPITASVFFMFMYDMFTAFQYYFAKTKWVMCASVTGAVLNVVLNMIFIPKFGFIAAGYTTLVCYILFGLAHYFFMCKVCDEFLDGARPYHIVHILAVGCLLIAGSFAMTLVYPYPAARYLLLCAAAAVVLLKSKKILGILSQMKK